MKILAIDTSTDYLSVALMDGEKVLGRFHGCVGRNHSDLLVPTIDRLLKRHRTKPKDLGGFCVGIGPGSFTGLRIGVTTVKGMAYALKKPIVAVPTMDAIAWNGVKFRGVICPVLDAKKKKVYACLYKSDGKAVRRISKYLLLPLDELKRRVERLKEKVLFLGDGVKLWGDEPGRTWYPNAETLARLGLEDFRKKRFVSAEDLEPMYIYSKECDITGK